MRIVFVQAGLGAGGAEKIVNLLAEHRHRLGDEVHVLAFRSPPGGSYFPYRKDIRIETPGTEGGAGGQSILRAGRRISWLRSRFRALKPDLIVSFLTKTNVLVMLASRGLGARVVISERNNPGMQRAHPLWRPASLLAARAADGIVMQTEEARKILPPGAQARAAVIPNPCTIPGRARAVQSDGSRIVAVGRLDRQKGFDLLLEAFALAAPAMPGATLTIFGEGPERAALETQARTLGIDQRVQLPGVTKSPGAWLEAGDIFVLSSRFEGFPNVLVEALAGGLAAVAFDCPWGPSSIVTHGKDGLLVPPADIEGLAQALGRLVTDSELRRGLAAAAAETADRFSLPNILARWDAAFATAAAR